MNSKQLLTTAGLILMTGTPAMATDTWFVRPYVGLSQMSDLKIAIPAAS